MAFRTLLSLDVVDGKLRSKPYRSEARGRIGLSGIKVRGRRVSV
jgi:hypothetical protein